ncbi:uncharacterized protein LOC124544587 [Schistocerca americana]|uniref:uncharacterized protein LOC124544587 n=1 Tax=Schistocerca americana TaxID=7009 RepID=UPI001F4F6916|nr:uncharacterized protein LOC124544587 [Schistocerca americana]
MIAIASPLATVSVFLLVLVVSEISCQESNLYHRRLSNLATFPVHFMLLKKDGSYHFGYDTGFSYREEHRWPTGIVEGQFGYEDPPGTLRVTHYTAGSHGYRATETLRYLVHTDERYHLTGPLPFSRHNKPIYYLHL